jgi:NADPH2:quinone reductase
MECLEQGCVMRAAWYERQGPAKDVLRVGEIPDPEPGPGEVRVQVQLSGVNPGDTKKRGGWLESPMSFPRIVPHSDGSGVIDAVGEGVEARRVGERVWVWGAQSYRAWGTAAEFTVVPADQAVPLPDGVSDELGACLGIPGITAHRAVFGDGPVTGSTVLVHGVLGGVGSLAAQLAAWGGATVIGTLRRAVDEQLVDRSVVAHTVALASSDPVERIRQLAPDGVDRVVEVSLSDNADLDAAVLGLGGVIAAYASREERPDLPFWPMLFNNTTVRLLGSDDFPLEAKHSAVADLTAAASDGALSVAISPPLPLDEVVAAHDLVDTGSGSRVGVAVR